MDCAGTVDTAALMIPGSFFPLREHQPNGHVYQAAAVSAFDHSSRIQRAQATLFSKIEYLCPAP
jgi:hypothetical protein